MATTTIRVDDELKARIAVAAKRAGKTAHAFILDAVAQTVAQDEADAELERIAEERWAKLLTTGESVPLDDAKAWIEARSRGERRRRPVARNSGC